MPRRPKRGTGLSSTFAPDAAALDLPTAPAQPLSATNVSSRPRFTPIGDHAASAPESDPIDLLLNGVQQRLIDTLGTRRYDLTFAHTTRLSVRPPGTADGAAAVRAVVPGRFFANRLRNDYADALRHAVNTELGRPDDAPVALTVHEDPAQFPDPTPRGAAPSPRRAATGAPARRPGQCRGFDAFVVGPSNRMAHAAAWSLASPAGNNPAAETFDRPSVLVLHGDCGLGKTHLLLAACQRAQELEPDARVRYLTGEQFVNQFIEAVRTNTLKTFRAGLRRLDLLAIDDAQFLANKTKSQQEFLHCFDHIEQSGARVIMASDQHPRDLPSFSAPLVSRCIKGLVVEVRAPDPATRLELIQRLARRRGLALRPGVAELVARHAGASVREIEGTVTRLQAVVSFGTASRSGSPAAGTRMPRAVSLQDAAQLAPHQATARAPRPVRFDEVLVAVTHGLHVSRDQIVAGSRQREVVLARGLLVHLARELTTLSYPEMARALNKRSHSTLVSSAGRFKTLLAADAPLLLTAQPGPVTPSQLVESLRTAVLDAAS